MRETKKKRKKKCLSFDREVTLLPPFIFISAIMSQILNNV